MAHFYCAGMEEKTIESFIKTGGTKVFAWGQQGVSSSARRESKVRERIEAVGKKTGVTKQLLD